MFLLFRKGEHDPKYSNAVLSSAVSNILKPEMERKYVETVGLQIGLKNCDPPKDAINANEHASNQTNESYKVCVLGDAQQCDETKAKYIPHTDVEALKSLKKDKKLVKKKPGRILGYMRWRQSSYSSKSSSAADKKGRAGSRHNLRRART